MMKKCAIACSAIFFLSFHASAQTYLHCDFSRGIPDGFTLIDNDALEPSAAMRKEGFAVGTPWIAQSPKGEDNPAACSTSWYAEKGTSDDWMITPPFTVSSAGSVLTWRAMASDKRNRDGYAVYVSTSASTAVDGFDRSAPLFSVGEEENAWTKHSVSLDGYVGKTITVAFVNNSTDKSRLYIDDINGVEGSVPTSFGADEPIVYEKSFPLPDKILDDRNTALVVMLIDRADNHVVNAQQAPLGANEVDGIAAPVRSQAATGQTAIYRPDGTRTASLRRGLNIVRTADGRVVKVAR